METTEAFRQWVQERNLPLEGDAQQGPQALYVPELASGPGEDGWLPAEAWEKVAPLSFVFLDAKGDAPQAPTTLRLATHRGWLYLHADCRDPDAAHLVYAATGRDSANLWRDDGLEIFLRAGEEGQGPLVQFIVNPVGALYDAKDKDAAWDPPARVRARTHGQGWSAELAVPLAALSEAERLPAIFRGNLSRSRKGREGAHSEETAWRSSAGSRTHAAEHYGYLYFEALEEGKALPAVEISQGREVLKELGDAGKLENALRAKFGVPARVVKHAETAPDFAKDASGAAWKDAHLLRLAPLNNLAARKFQETSAQVLAGREGLFFRIVCSESGEIVAQARENGKGIWLDDGIEIYLAPGRKESADYRHVIVNAKGEVYTGIGKRTSRLEGVEAKMVAEAGRWTAQVFVPYAACGAVADEVPVLWGVNVIRNRAARPGVPGQASIWSSPGASSFHDPGRFGALWLAGANRFPELGTKEDLEALAKRAPPVETTADVATDASTWNVFTLAERDEKALRGMVARHMKKILDAQYADFDRRVYGAKDWDAWLKVREEMRAAFRKSVGLPDAKTPLNPRVSVVAENDEIRVERLVFESQPGFFVPANCWVPKKRHGKKVPAVIRVEGHATRGRLGGAINFCEDLARRGYFAIAVDQLGQGERIYTNSGLGGRTPTSNHYNLGMGCTLTGANLAGFMIHDVIRALDYLETREEVDMTRVTMTGASGGGTMTSYVAALDDRLCCAAPVSAVGPYRNGGGNYDSEQVLFDMVRGGFEAEGRCAAVAPRPLTVIREVNGDDPDGRAMYERVRQIFAMQDAGEKLLYQPTHEPHGYGKGHARLFHEWLAQAMPPNADAHPAKEKLDYDRDDCRACSGSSVFFSREFAGCETVYSINAKRAVRALAFNEKIAGEDERKQRAGEIRKVLRELLALPEGDPKPRAVEARDAVAFEGVAAEKLILETDESVYVPAVLFKPKGEGRAPVVLWLNERGKAAAIAQRWSAMKALLEQGVAILVPDLRGIGETAADDDATYMGEETSLNGYGYRIGAPLIGMRVRDVLGCIAMLRGRTDVDPKRIALLGDNPAPANPATIRQPRLQTDAGLEDLQHAESLGPALAVLAGALDERLACVAAHGALGSYADATRRAYVMHPLAAFVPGILRYADVADIAALSAPRPLVLAGSVDAWNRRFAQDGEIAQDLRRAHAECAHEAGMDRVQAFLLENLKK